jgi:23S rRNA (cytosine1962-C5)-methyltransferase
VLEVHPGSFVFTERTGGLLLPAMERMSKPIDSRGNGKPGPRKDAKPGFGGGRSFGATPSSGGKPSLPFGRSSGGSQRPAPGDHRASESRTSDSRPPRREFGPQRARPASGSSGPKLAAPGNAPSKFSGKAGQQAGAGSGPKIVPKASPRSLGAKVNRRAADKLREGYLWVYASDIESIEIPGGAGSGGQAGNAPALLPVADSRGLLLGTALYSPASQIALRMVSREAIDEAAWVELLAERLGTAIGRRQRLLTEDTDACRLCFSEADELPGLIADKYGDLVILQLLVKGLDSAAVREACVRVIREKLSPAAILERPDARTRELEGLSAPSVTPLFRAEAEPGSDGKAVGGLEFLLNGLRFQFDANSGQKTGAFLDQRDNYAAAQHWAKALGVNGEGRALDVCCYQGGFALHLAQVCKRVTGIDASRASLEVAERNFAANRDRMSAEVDWVEGDAFQIMRDWSDAGEKFDAIVLDPPAFAKSQRAVEGALRGYKELNLRALKMLRPGGLLVTCSCSHHVGWAELEASVAAAAIDAGRRVRLLERRGASLDHPVVLNLPETEYLKCLMLQVE